MEFSRQEYWGRLPLLRQENFLPQGLNMCLLGLLHWKADSLPLVPPDVINTTAGLGGGGESGQKTLKILRWGLKL